MPWPLRIYLVAWCAAILLGLFSAIRGAKTLSLLGAEYRRGLGRPWKLATFALAAGFFVLIAPHSGDPTWDIVDATLMSGLTYLTAPWAVGTLYRALRKKSSARDVYLALVAWMFSASWCYDGWLLIRDGRYPPSWSSNILASSVLYVSAGFFWSAAQAPGRGLVFAFMLDDWPSHAEGPSVRVLWLAAVFALLVAAMMTPFILNALGR